VEVHQVSGQYLRGVGVEVYCGFGTCSSSDPDRPVPQR
jgi:hypothetical protein